MTMTNKADKKVYTAFDLFARFCELRQNNVNRDEAWSQICEAVPDMSDVVRNAFLTLAKNWERREGHKYHYRTESKDDTMTRKQVGDVQAAQEQHKQQEAARTKSSVPQPPVIQPPAPTQPPAPKPRPNPALTGPLDPRHLQEYELNQMEQVLDMLDEQEQESASPVPPHPMPNPRQETSPIRYAVDFFGPRTILLMYFRNYPHPLRVIINGSDELYIGRATANSAMSPEIDLNPVNAGNYGVSRMHAAVTRRDNKLLIVDLESMNYTYVNGMRLMPNTIAPLKDGDEIWFGQLQCRIRFQHT